MVESSAARNLDLIFQALSDSTRRSILKSLAKHERTVSEIAKPHQMSLAAVSKHIKVLEAAHLIRRKKVGSFQMVSLNAPALKSASQWLTFYEKFWNQKLEALKDF